MMVRGRRWTVRDGAMLLLAIGIWMWVFETPLRDILRLALRDEEQSHILLAPFVAAWLFWYRRSRLHLLRVRPNLIGCGVVAAGCLASWWGFQTDTYILWHGGPVIALVGIILSMTGPHAVRYFGPAFAALLFLLPVPGTVRAQIAIPLQSIAAQVTHQSLEIFGFEAARMGNLLLINGQQVAVAEACNGMRLVFSLTIVVFAFAFSVPLRPGVRILLLLLSPMIALIANIIRLIPTSVMYGVTTVDNAERFHDISGWVMLPLALFGLLGIMRLLKWLELPVTSYRLASS
jgi:exosortase